MLLLACPSVIVGCLRGWLSFSGLDLILLACLFSLQSSENRLGETVLGTSALLASV